MVAAGDLRNIAQVARIRKFLEHFDGLDDVVINFKPFFKTEGTTPNLKIINLTPVVEVLRFVELEPPLVLLRYVVFAFPGNEMFVPVGKQSFFSRNWYGSGTLFSLPLFPGDSYSVVKGADPGSAGNFIDTLNQFIG